MNTGLKLPDHAAFKPINAMVAYEKRAGGAVFSANMAQITIKFLDHEIVHFSMMPDQPHDGDVIAPDSRAVIYSGAQDLQIAVTDLGDRVELASDKLRVVVTKNPLRVDYFNSNSIASGSVGWLGLGAVCRNIIKADEHFYAFGEKTGYLDKRGQRLEMWNTDVNPYLQSTDCLYMSIPFYIAHSKAGAYGVFLDSPGRTVFDVGQTEPEILSMATRERRLNYYFFAGPRLEDVIEQYTRLTGRMALPPLWSLGYHQSRYSYSPQAQVEKVAARLRENEIPCDAIHLDIHYMDGFRVFTFSPKHFPDPHALCQKLNKMGFKAVSIVDPGVKIDEEYGPYLRGMAGNHFVREADGQPVTVEVWPGEVHLPDFFREETREWWSEEHAVLFDAGISGIWNDMNEPAAFDTPDKTLPHDALHGNVFEEVRHELVHNLYANRMAEASVMAFQMYKPGERPFVISRAGYSGIQRYACTWTGDNSSWWEHLEMAIPMCLNLGLSGQPFCGSDIGGFLFNSNPELVTRWTQLGVFMPLFRNHSAIGTSAQEPFVLPEPFLAICREAIRFRYRLLPYFYTLMYRASLTGCPVMRPLVLDYPQDERVHRLFDQFLFGDSVMVAPVTKPGDVCRHVYLPEGVWLDYLGGRVWQGPVDIVADAPLERIPIFLKSGTILPLAPVMNHTGEQDPTIEYLDIFPGDTSVGAFDLYYDDGRTLRYQQGESAIWHFDFQSNGTRLSVRAAKSGPYDKPLPVRVLRCFAQGTPPVSVSVNGNAVAPGATPESVMTGRFWYFDVERGCLLIGVHYDGIAGTASAAGAAGVVGTEEAAGAANWEMEICLR
ncbi:MAG TPA: alpha-glucosidase [Firmicutes bacterium]|nr:alpha-glucosidase [Bacillota bacterium]